MDDIKTTINLLPGYFLAIIDDTQMANVSFKGDDQFDRPQKGLLIKLNPQDTDRKYSEKDETYGSLIGKRVMWAKYAESDCFIWDDNLQKDVVIISLDKLRGYEDIN